MHIVQLVSKTNYHALSELVKIAAALVPDRDRSANTLVYICHVEARLAAMGAPLGVDPRPMLGELHRQGLIVLRRADFVREILLDPESLLRKSEMVHCGAEYHFVVDPGRSEPWELSPTNGSLVRRALRLPRRARRTGIDERALLVKIAALVDAAERVAVKDYAEIKCVYEDVRALLNAELPR